MNITKFREYLGLMSQACQALSEAKKASDQDDVRAYLENFERSIKCGELAKKIDENDPSEKDSSSLHRKMPGSSIEK